jgi:hypothetical protein
VHEFGDSDGRERHLDFTESAVNALNQLQNGEAFSLSRDNNSGVEDYSQEGGFRACWWLAMIVCKSLLKSESSVTVELRSLA